MIDMALDPRWGRIAEGFGESPYAASVFCVAAVKGFQGDDLAAPDSIAACLKHFVGYGASRRGPRLQLCRYLAAAALGNVSAAL